MARSSKAAGDGSPRKSRSTPKAANVVPMMKANVVAMMDTRAASMMDANLVCVLSEEQIRARAYEIYRSRGGVPGSELADWLQAEQELQAEANGGRALSAAL